MKMYHVKTRMGQKNQDKNTPHSRPKIINFSTLLAYIFSFTMGYYVNLPPRYVQHIKSTLSQHVALEEEDSTICSLEQRTHEIPRSVSFDEGNSRTFFVPVFDMDATWYSCTDILAFKTNWNVKKRETETPRRKKKHILGQRRIPLMEDLQTFGSESSENRKKLIKCILDHQAFCRSQGFSDPDGIFMLSRNISRGDRRTAWRAAATNAYEVDGFHKESSSVSFGSLFMDYYWQSIHPNLDDPLSFLSKVVLCQCE